VGERRKAYVHRSPDGLDLGLALIQYGFAYARRDYPYTRQPAYIAAEDDARTAGRGYWPKLTPTLAPENPAPASPVVMSTITAMSRRPAVRSTPSAPSITSNETQSSSSASVPKRRTKRYAQQPDPFAGGQGLLGLPMFGAPAFGNPGSVFVNGYYRNNGTYVQPYFRRPPGG
jgi:hypothetical protein